MKVSVKFSRKENNIICDMVFEKGEKDPPQINVEGKTLIFTKQDQNVLHTQRFGAHDGDKADEWSRAVVEDVKRQVLEWRIKLPQGYNEEF